MISITKKDIAWNYLGTILNQGMNVLILPFILRLLSPQELGLWYVFASVAALVQLMDFGFAPSIMRNISYAWSGAKELKSDGISGTNANKDRDYSLIGSLVSASKKIYLIISLSAGIVLLSVGSIYVNSLLPQNSEQMMLAWIVYALAVYINLYYSYLSAMLRGIGKIKETNQALVMSRALYVVSAIIGLLLGGGLLWMSASYLFSGLLMMFMSKIYFKRSIGHELDISHSGSKDQAANIMRTIWPNAKKQGIVTIGAWMTTRASTLICSSFLGLETTSQYGLSLTLINITGGIASLLFGSYAPELASLKINDEKKRYIKIFSRAISVQWFVAILGISMITFAAPPVLKAIGSNSKLLPTGTLFILGVVYFLEWNHSTFATLITLSNSVPFVKSAMYSGTSIVVLSFLSIWLTDFQIIGLILSQGIVQLAYNNWRWPKLVLDENNITIRDIITSSADEMRAVFNSKKSRDS